MRQKTSPLNHGVSRVTTMLPFKSQRHLLTSYSNLSEERERAQNNCIDRVSFDELSRKVDWLVEEVHYLRQIIGTYEKQRRSKSYNNDDQPSKSDRQHEFTGVSTPHYGRIYRPDINRSNSRSSYYDRESESSPFNQPRKNSFNLSTTEQEAIREKRNDIEHKGDTNDFASKMPHYSNLYREKRPSSEFSDSPRRRESDNDVSQNIVPMQEARLQTLFSTTNSINIAETIMLWQHGLNDIPPVIKWSTELKKMYREKIKDWFRVFHLFQTLCNGNIGLFISRYTNSLGHMMSVSQVASMCPNIDAAFESFLNMKSPASEFFPSFPTQEEISEKADKIHVLPRKINGRKVSAKDVIELWENGIGDIPPIKTWSKTQKFKQQSKISRWKKIVDIFKYQCHRDMKKFEEIYTDSHGCLLPVAAITTKFETIYGDELNITSKLMTVTTNDDDRHHDTNVKLPRHEGEGFRKRKHDDSQTPNEISYDDSIFDNQSPPFSTQNIEQISKTKNEDSCTDYKMQGFKSFTATKQTPTGYLTTENMDEIRRHSSSSSVSSRCEMLDRQFRYDSSRSNSFEKEPFRKQSDSDAPSNQTTVLDIKETARQNNENPIVHVVSPSVIIKEEEESSDEVEIIDSRFLGNYDKKTAEFSITFDNQSSPSNSDSETKEFTLDMSPEPIIPENISVLEAIELWKNGSANFKPIKDWSSSKKACNKLAQKIEDIFYIFQNVFKSDYATFKIMCTENNTLLTIDESLAKFSKPLKERTNEIDLCKPTANSMTFDFSHHKTVSANSDVLYLLPRKINGKKVNARDVLQLWYYGLNKIPPVKNWSAQQKSVQQSKISRWKKIVDLYERDYKGDWDLFEKTYSNGNGQLIPITAIIAKREEELLRNTSDGSMVIQYKSYSSQPYDTLTSV
ncbi:uncharacterized protein LOC100215655 [Hydra vulgaris]|uniref:Uncharacterized protein LOC100215655 n=1 Tax=Hydra vulgaris TaxID=6087 RepID=A0ABM4DIL5_HYDVU